MKRATSVFCIFLIFCTAVLAQQATQPAPNAPKDAAPVQTPKPAPAGPTLEDSTPLKLRISQTVSSADAHVGQTVDFEVLEEIKVNDTVVVPKGGVAWATVTEAEPKRRMGRGGKLNINIDSVRLVDGEKVALRAVKEGKGGGHVGAMTGAIVATSIVFFPAAPLFLFMHGKDITIPKGTEITAFVNGDVPLDLAKFRPTGSPVVAASATVSGQETLEFSSNPQGADIEVDGSFVGTTPSSITVAPGDHAITIRKSGYKAWERKMKTSSGSVKVVAELEQDAKAEVVKPAMNGDR
jgi:PEGA domain